MTIQPIEWVCLHAIARKLDMDYRATRKFLETAGVRCRQLPSQKKQYSLTHAVELLNKASEGQASA